MEILIVQCSVIGEYVHQQSILKLQYALPAPVVPPLVPPPAVATVPERCPVSWSVVSEAPQVPFFTTAVPVPAVEKTCELAAQWPDSLVTHVGPVVAPLLDVPWPLTTMATAPLVPCAAAAVPAHVPAEAVALGASCAAFEVPGTTVDNTNTVAIAVHRMSAPRDMNPFISNPP